MSIRKFVENDRKVIFDIYAQSKLDELKHEAIEFKLLPLEQDKSRLNQLNESDIYVYEENGVVGYGAHYDSVIRALFVLPKYRGKGIGEKLLEYILSKISGVATLYVAASNNPAISLYEKYGFRIINEFETSYNKTEVRAVQMEQVSEYT